MKKKIFSLAMVICCLAVLTISGTLAYFTAEDTATNVITTGTIDIDLKETIGVDPETGEDIPFTDVTGVMPSQAIDKIVTVKNINDAMPAFVRVLVTPTITLAQEYADKQDEIDLSLISIDYNTRDWTYNEEDGYWYYNEILETGAETPALFTKVTFAKEMGNMYQGATVTIDVRAEAVQVKNNPGTTALTAQGWPAPQA